MNILVVEDEENIQLSPREKNRLRVINPKLDNEITLSDIKDKAKFDYDLAFRFLKSNDPDTLRVIMKKLLRQAKLPFRDFDRSKEEYFDKLPEMSDERIAFEQALHKACEEYIEDIDPEEYDKQQQNRRNMNNFMMGMMMGLLENKVKKINKKYTKKQITEAIAYWKKQLNESTDLTS